MPAPFGSTALLEPPDLAAAGRSPSSDVLALLDTTADGLSDAEVAARRRRFGPNVLAVRRVTAVGVLVRQLRNPLLILLLAVAAVSVVIGDAVDGVIITAIVLLSVGLGFVNEYRSQLAVAALHGNIRHVVQARRDGRPERVDVRDLVPGDVVTMRVGDVIPADVRLLESTELECDESVLTGESVSAVKEVAPAAGDSPVDLPSCAFMGTVVHEGAGVGVVVATGTRTAFGRIAVGPQRAPGGDGLPGRPAAVLGPARAGRGGAHGVDPGGERRPGPPAAGGGPVLAGDRHRHHAPAPARDRQRQPRRRLPSAGPAQGAREATGDHRGSRQHRGALHGQDRHPHRGCDHVRPGPRHRRASGERAAAAGGAVQRGDDDARRSRRRQRAGRRALVGRRRPAADHHGGRGGLRPARPGPLRPRAAGRLRARARAGRSGRARHEGGAGGGPRPLRRRAGRGIRGARSPVRRRCPCHRGRVAPGRGGGRRGARG